jgi:3-mercaptopyruvate sulfurtransferase SseA
VALLLRKQGVKHIRPLQGGLDGWREAGFPLQNAMPDEPGHDRSGAQLKT